MKEYKIDLSMLDGEAREGASATIQRHAFRLGYAWWCNDGAGVKYKNSPHLFTDKNGYLSMVVEKDIQFFTKHENTEISITDFLALKPEDVKEKPVPEFKPFDKVLARDSDCDEWGIDFFESFSEDSPYSFQCLGSCWKQCIPYEGNEHLLGTTEEPK